MAQAEPLSPELPKPAEIPSCDTGDKALAEGPLGKKTNQEVFTVLNAIIDKPDHILIRELLHSPKTELRITLNEATF